MRLHAISCLHTDVCIDHSSHRDTLLTTLAYVRIIATRGQEKAQGSTNPSRTHARDGGDIEGSVFTRNNQQAYKGENIRGDLRGYTETETEVQAQMGTY